MVWIESQVELPKIILFAKHDKKRISVTALIAQFLFIFNQIGFALFRPLPVDCDMPFECMIALCHSEHKA